MSEALDSGRNPVVDSGAVPGRVVQRPVAAVPSAKPKGDRPRCQLEPLPDDWRPQSVTEMVEAHRAQRDELLRALCGDVRDDNDDSRCAGGAGDLFACEQPLECTRAACFPDDNGPTFGPRCLPSGAGGVVEGEPVRGERELARPGRGLPRRSWYLRRELDRVRRAARLRPRMGGDAR